MSALVKCFAYEGIVAAKVGVGKYSTDSLYMLKQPYLAREAITETSASAGSIAAANVPNGTNFLLIEVQEGKIVHYEVNPPSRPVNAATSSPTLHGKTQINYGPGWTVSFLEQEVS